MTISELIETLKQFPPDRIVLVDGYEGGYDNPKGAYSIQVQKRGYESYSGEYEEHDPNYNVAVEWAVIIPRWHC